MGKLVLFFVVACFCYSQSAVIMRTLQETRDFENFLKNAVDGKYSEPLTPELGDLQNIEERSGKFEGDMLLTEQQKRALVAEFSEARNAILDIDRLWPNNVVYYKIATNNFTEEQIFAIEAAIANIELVSCLEFRKRTTEANYIRVTGSSDGCYADVGYRRGAQKLNLIPNIVGKDCFRHGTIIHEFLHSLGFYHMQSTHNRDDWVEIIWDNIEEEGLHNFEKFTSAQVTNFGQNYDYGSVLHYSEYAFSVNDEKTIIPLQDPGDIKIGQRWGMSKIDVKKLNALYPC